MTLNEKIGVILKQHKEGEEFFNALDFMIKGDRSILEDFLYSKISCFVRTGYSLMIPII